MSEISPELMRIMTRDYSQADYQYELIMKRIRNFESQLDSNHEIALMLASFGESITIAVTSIEYHNPSLILFNGFVNGSQATLIQHISQLSFLMLAVLKSEPDRPARRIGFETSNHEQ